MKTMTKILLAVGATIVATVVIGIFVMRDWHFVIIREKPTLFFTLFLWGLVASGLCWGWMLSSRWVYKVVFLGAFIVSGFLFSFSKYQKEARVIVYRNAAEHGDANAKYELGQKYEYGCFEVGQNKAEAVNWYSKAAKLGHADAQYELGDCYAKGNGVEKSEAEAVKWFRKAAEQGHADAQYNLGFCYDEGNGVEKNEVEAVKWFRKAAEQGHGLAKLTLGLCYKRGEGVPQSEAESKAWLGKIKSPRDLYATGAVFFESDKSEAVKWFLKAAEQDEKSIDGDEKIFVASAQHMLGLCYLGGTGVPQDKAEGIKWLKKAAKNGDKKAQETLGEMDGILKQKGRDLK